MSGTEIKAAVGSKASRRCGCSAACLCSTPSPSKKVLTKLEIFSPNYVFQLSRPCLPLEQKSEFLGVAGAEGLLLLFLVLVKVKRVFLGTRREY